MLSFIERDTWSYVTDIILIVAGLIAWIAWLKWGDHS